MKNLQTYLSDIFQQSLEKLALPQPESIAWEHPTNPTFGDYSTNLAMSLFSQLKTGENPSAFTNPRALATAIAETAAEIEQTQEGWAAEITVAGPGFINVTLNNNYFYLLIHYLTFEHSKVIPSTSSGEKVMVEFTDPNPFKEFHIGHLYSNTVGESISRLFETIGAEVKRACYQGDVGMHVAKSVWGMKQKMASNGQTLAQLEKAPIHDRVKFLGQAYALGATAFEEDEQAQQEIKEINFLTFLSAQEYLQETIDWQPQVDYRQFLTQTALDFNEIKELYVQGRAWSLAYFESIYTRLGMQFDEFFFESLVGEYGVKIVKKYLEQGIFKESQGAVIFPGSEYGLHDRVFINSLGLPTYECKELGLAPEKYRRFPYDLSLIITGNEINEYFKVLLTALGQTNPELAKKTKHLSHGMVRLPEGKMSSRTGKILTGEWLLHEAHQRIREIIAETRPNLHESEVAIIAEKVGLAAIKYAFLKQGIGKDIAFDFDESLSFQGNSGPYLQYTYVRCHSILTKAAESNIVMNIAEPFDTDSIYLNDDEKAVARELGKYSETLKLAAQEYAPHHLCTYLYTLAQSFNAFYNKCSVLGEEVPPDTQQLRLQLTKATANVLQHGLHILGIETVEQM